jgi:hypothetical protein
VAHAINENLWREIMRNDEDDDEDDRKKRVMSRFLSQPFSYLWLGRDIASYAINRGVGEYASIKPPLASAAENMLKPIPDGLKIMFTDKDIDIKYFEGLAKAGAILTPYPQQINSIVFNFIDWLNNEGEASWKDLMSRRIKK